MPLRTRVAGGSLLLNDLLSKSLTAINEGVGMMNSNFVEMAIVAAERARHEGFTGTEQALLEIVRSAIGVGEMTHIMELDLESESDGAEN